MTTRWNLPSQGMPDSLTRKAASARRSCGSSSAALRRAWSYCSRISAKCPAPALRSSEGRMRAAFNSSMAWWAGDRDIQTAVVEHESGPAGANERENHDIALATLKSLDGIDGDPGTGQHLTQQDDLSTEGRNNTDGFGIDAAIPREGLHELDNCPRFIRV